MMSDPLNAANAYQNIARQMSGIAGGDKADTSSKLGNTAGSSAEGVDFMKMVKSAAEEAIDTMKSGESASADALTGDIGLPELVQAVSAAELTLQTTVAVRDRMISAYQEIMRMPI